MDINERIDSIGEYFKLFTITKNITYVLVTLPKNWVVDSSYADGEVTVKADNKSKDSYYFVSSYDSGIDIVFDTLEAVINANLEIMAKNRLFQDKINELKDLFENENIDRLNTLSFNMESGDMASIGNLNLTIGEGAPVSAQSENESKKDRKKKGEHASDSVMDLAEKIAEGEAS